MYGHDGYMSVAFMSAGRPAFTSKDLRGGTVEEKALAVDTYTSYCGRYELRGDRLVHHIEVSLFPNWTGQDHERFYAFDGDTLTLSTPPLPLEGFEQTAHLVWRRCAQAGDAGSVNPRC
jgi:hypothetical protein